MTDPTFKTRRRRDYPYILEFRTRWHDNDLYGHLNNATYYQYFDSIVNTYLATYCYSHANSTVASTGLDASSTPTSSPHTALQTTRLIGLVIHSSCTYLRPASFPGVVDVAMRVAKLGKSSVEYECAVFEGQSRDSGVLAEKRGGGTKNEEEDEIPCAVGRFVHVFVGRESRKVEEGGMGEGIREGLRRVFVEDKNMRSTEQQEGQNLGSVGKEKL